MARDGDQELDKLVSESEKGVDGLKVESKIHRLERELNSYKARQKTMLDDNERLQALLDLKSVFEEHEPTKIFGEQYCHASKSPVAAIVPLSDWHVEERVDKKKTNGLNEYNPEIAKRRAERTFRMIVEYIRRYTPAARILILALLGDFITGYIHEDLRLSNYMPPNQALLLAYDLLVEGIEEILAANIVDEIIVPTAVGNHGRTGEKQLVQMSEETSFEWLMYHMIARHFKGNDKITFIVSDTYLNHVNIFGRTIRFHHGEAIRYNGGVGGPTISANKKIAGWNKSPIKAELDVFGHLHTFFNGGDFVMNGSLIGSGAYSQKHAFPFEPPTQAFIGFSQSRGQYMTAKIYADD